MSYFALKLKQFMGDYNSIWNQINNKYLAEQNQ